VALIKTDYKEGRLQPTPAGHPHLVTPRANYFLLVSVLNKIDLKNEKPEGKFHDQGKWIVIRGQLRGHNDTVLYFLMEIFE
jgi:hypothetical protein